jgi:hypothetical protein
MSGFSIVTNGFTAHYWALAHFFSCLILYAVGKSLDGDQPDKRPLPTQGQHWQNKRTQISMALLEFEPTISEFERVKTVFSFRRYLFCFVGLCCTVLLHFSLLFCKQLPGYSITDFPFISPFNPFPPSLQYSQPLQPLHTLKRFEVSIITTASLTSLADLSLLLWQCYN